MKYEGLKDKLNNQFYLQLYQQLSVQLYNWQLDDKLLVKLFKQFDEQLNQSSHQQLNGYFYWQIKDQLKEDIECYMKG